MRVLRGMLFALLGLIAGFLLVAVLGLLFVPSRAADSGGREMFVFFGLAPLGAVAGAIGGLVLGLRRRDEAPPD